MTVAEKAGLINTELKKLYPGAVCSLNCENPFELLVAVRLSAQCTDKRVNTVTPVLFAKFKTLDDYAAADVEDVEGIIHSCGFFHGKARDIIGMASSVRDNYGGRVPDTVEELIKLPGVGRKTANLIVGDVYGKPAVVTDTHVIRISNRWGLSSSKEPVKVENALRAILPPEESNDFCHRTVMFGRDICTARSPRCESCPMKKLCREYTVKSS